MTSDRRPRRVAGLVLAAGGGSRWEEGFKLLAPWRGEPLVAAPVRAALEAGLSPVVVVTGHRANGVRAAVAGCLEAGAEAAAGEPDGEQVIFVENPRWREGQATSLAAGLRAVRRAGDAAAAVVLLGDEPEVDPGLIRRVVEVWEGGAAPAVRTRYADRPGHPVLLDRSVFPELEAGLPERDPEEADRGAGPWMRRHPDRVAELRVEAPAPRDVDTREDYRGLTGTRPPEP